METNVIGTIHLFEAVRKLNISPKIQVAGSSEEYGMVNPNELPITEENPLRPLSPYAVSKVAVDKLSYQYHMSYGLHIVVTRGFNHTGPRRGEVFVSSNFAKQIAEIEKGAEPIIHVGNLDAMRDFTDVRDMVRGYLLAVDKGQPGESYNICSGESITIRDLLDLLISMSRKKIKVQQDPDRMRPSDVEVLQGDCSKFKKQTGWEQTIPFKETMEDLLNYWRERV
jgi:GDP-4-dehydro-6-deoxy-D-mannose reductase